MKADFHAYSGTILYVDKSNLEGTPTRKSPIPQVMGILNVTPDSFSDGGRWLDPQAAIQHALRMKSDGAALIDVGAESTRPGSFPTPPKEQIRRAIPVIAGIRKEDPTTTISIDTTSAAVAQAALDAGANWVNDTSALRDDSLMAEIVAQRNCHVVLMHRRGATSDMQAEGGPLYQDAIAEVRCFLQDRIAYAMGAGIPFENILVDPGIGFGKRAQHNIELVRGLQGFFSLAPGVVLGVSRKRFLGDISGQPDPALRDAESIACAVLVARGMDRNLAVRLILRVHNVAATVAALRIAEAMSPDPLALA